MSLHDEPAQLDVAPSREESDGHSQGSGEGDHPARRTTDQTFESGRTCQTGDTESTIIHHAQRPRSTEYHLPPAVQESLPSTSNGPHQTVRRDLQRWQIFFIVISGTIGLGLFTDSGEILRLAGPGGAILAFVLVGLGVISVMSGIAEMIDHWPISGALVEFVRSFVDKDLAVPIGIAYWGAYSITFGTLISAMLDIGGYWHWPEFWRFVAFGIATPILALGINLMGVNFYGMIESVIGILKLFLVVGTFLLMCVINAGGGPADAIGSKYINEGFRSDSTVTTSPFVAFLAGIPIAVYAFGGVEIIAVTAIEAKDPPGSLKWPAKSVAAILWIGYIFSVLGFYLNVSWQDSSLPSMVIRESQQTLSGSSILIIAANNSKIPGLPGFLNGALLLTVFSAANTTIYVASRTLFGLAKGLDCDGGATSRIFSHLGTTWPLTNVPAWAVVASAVSFIWLPWLHAGLNYGDQSLQQTFSGIATVAIVLVWASQCLAFIRYRRWYEYPSLTILSLTLIRLYLNRDHLNGELANYSYEKISSGALSYFQPFLAYFGFFGCFTTVFVFSTANWWYSKKPTASNILVTFTAPVLIIIFWLAKKRFSPSSSGHWGVKVDRSIKGLKDEIIRLESFIKTPPSNSSDAVEQVGRTQWQRIGSELATTSNPLPMPFSSGAL
ncbi:uncharacterized protein PAC_01359 [Phialocephala subalpina]|uniref:Amino acid permease/ SLC12A domain-containing protein n=1 Tax=Phialocephala subalpina TaxID=576137 RepID=A0A1L7WFD0_9HELO|nr:uncharacterized protein PAC_01359 [Phialocephala subalpina]